jgi:ABC-type Zn uptake system ZnuABC Zn-binding protein ZnuA
VAAIEAALVQVDPANAGYYHDRAAPRLRPSWPRSTNRFGRAMQQCARRDNVTSHQAFG